MKKGIFLMAMAALITTSSCSLFWKKINDTVKKAGDIQSRAADSMKMVIISEKNSFEMTPSFAARMDTLYMSGFQLADLVDSLQQHPDDEATQEEYNKELRFFRNYVNKHFDYDDRINSGLSTLGIGAKLKSKKGQTNDLPVEMGVLFNTLVKPSIMNIIIACRSQYDLSDSTDSAK